MKINLIAAIIISFFTYGCVTSPSYAPQLTETWVLEGFDSPESIIRSHQSDILFVSNVNGEGDSLDGNGYISRISKTGEMVQKKWAINLNGPKGMALSDGHLYVSDIDKLVAIDPGTGETLSRYPAKDAGFLNDVVSPPQGILVSDSANARLYQLKEGELTIYLEDPRLEGVNGLFMDGDVLLITTMSAGELLLLNMKTQALSSIATGMKNADAISIYKREQYLVSSWPGKIYHVGKDGAVLSILDTQDSGVYQNDFLVMDGVIYSPNWEPSTVRAYKIE